MSISFTSGLTTVTIDSPALNYPVPTLKHQALGLTAGGIRYAYDKGGTLYQVTLLLESLSNTDMTALQSFYYTTVTGSLTTFTFTDSDANTYTARFMEFAPQKYSYNIWDVSITLELSAVYK